jgi:hypothetical protein
LTLSSVRRAPGHVTTPNGAAMRAELEAVVDDIDRSLALLRRHL